MFTGLVPTGPSSKRRGRAPCRGSSNIFASSTANSHHESEAGGSPTRDHSSDVSPSDGADERSWPDDDDNAFASSQGDKGEPGAILFSCTSIGMPEFGSLSWTSSLILIDSTGLGAVVVEAAAPCTNCRDCKDCARIASKTCIV